jgi:hypothetical protein
MVVIQATVASKRGLRKLQHLSPLRSQKLSYRFVHCDSGLFSVATTHYNLTLTNAGGRSAAQNFVASLQLKSRRGIDGNEDSLRLDPQYRHTAQFKPTISATRAPSIE